MKYAPPLTSRLHMLGSRELFEEITTNSAAAYRRRLREEGVVATDGAMSSFYRSFLSFGLLQWFGENNLESFLENAYLCVKSNIMQVHARPTSTSGCSADAKALLYALIVNDEELLHWHKQFTLPFLGGGVNERLYKLPYEYQHLCLQIRLALQQDWLLLGERSEQALATEPKKNKLYRVDYQFFKALAGYDQAAMQSSLDELLSPQVLRHRHGDWGREPNFFAAWGMVYFKLAQLAGFTLETNSLWMPQAWLPSLQLSTKPRSIDFIDDFDVFTPFFDNAKSGWCKNASQFTPRPLSEPPLMFREVEQAFAGKIYKGGI